MAKNGADFRSLQAAPQHLFYTEQKKIILETTQSAKKNVNYYSIMKDCLPGKDTL